MDETTPAARKLDVGAALGPSFTYVKERLFSSISIEIWLTLGFVSFIDQFGNGGIGGLLNFNSTFGPSPVKGIGQGPEAVEPALDRAIEFVRANIPWITAIVAVGLVIDLLIRYLGVRGTFMYIDNVARRKVEVAEPWRRSGRHATSYYLWRLAFVVASFAAILLSAAPAVVVIYRILVQKVDLDPSAIGILFLSTLFFVIVLLAISIVGMLLHDFVAPIMYRFGLSGREAWGLFLRAARGNVLQITLYFLLQIAVGMAFGTAVVLVMFGTCCFGLLPVILQTILQPFLLFARVYPLYVLEGLGPEFRIVEPTSDPWAAPAAPPPPPPPGDQDLDDRR